MGYYLGLDMGTSTVGWAVTDKNYNLLRKKGKDLWGVREFEEAESAAERRAHRISRRNNERSKARIGILKSYFADAIAEVDVNFYARLENSKYHLEDKDDNVKSPNSIFDDKDYTDCDYFEQYPTIFHLRSELIHNKDPHDVRLVFLALLNMFKHRGHFLNAGSVSDGESGMGEAYQRLREILENNLDISLAYLDETVLQDILGDRNLSRSARSEKLCEMLGIDKKQKKETAIIKTMCGLKGDAKVLFGLEDLNEKVEIQFSSFGYDEKESEINAAIGDELFEIVNAMKQVYDIGSLSGILKGFSYLSDARISDYEKHGKDLKALKSVMKKYSSCDEYNKMFRSEENGSYSAYVNSVSYDRLYAQGERSKHRRNMKDRKAEDFYKKVKKCLGKMPGDDDQVSYVLREIELERFMPKQLSASNGVIPNQVHAKEMKAILENAKEYLAFLNEKDEGGRTIAERILMLFSFQIPYYIGPISESSAKNGGNGWVIRKEEGKVMPWNIDQKINMKRTSEEFILRMVRTCTYINGERVLPKSSLLYERYCVLNEINNIRIDNEKISPELKQDIYNDLFKYGKRVTRKQLFKYLEKRTGITDETQISGIDITINNSLGSYGKFRAIFGDAIDTDSCRNMIEEIIFWCTVYGDSKKFLIQNIKECYPEIDDAKIKRITGMKFKDWGRFSKEFLCLQGCNKETGEVMSLITALWETNLNLMELINSTDFTFRESLDEKHESSIGCLSEFTHNLLDEYYFSAPVKKMIWQTLGIIKELELVLGESPEKIFIEMTRTDEEKGDRGRKDSRKKKLLELYKGVKDDICNWKELIEKSDENGKLRSKKMYLYLTQMGRDMYTGDPIDLDELFNNNLYDVDHIYPRHFVKDDSIHNNLVLVRKEKNAHKSDTYPLEIAIRHSEKVRNLWEMLRKKEMITEEKYRRLTGSREFTEEQKADFIARQLVETAQATKGVADLLKQLIPDSEIVYAKAGNVSDFRRKYELYKSRLVNDFHHANDAYLNIVVGNVYLTKFTNNPRNFIRNEYMKDEKKYNYNLSRMFDKDVIRNGQTAWIAPKDDGSDTGTIITVKKTMYRNTPIITRQSFTGHGGIADQTLYGHKKAKEEGYIPLKSSDPKIKDVLKYGGFSSVSTAYFFLVEHTVKGKTVRTLETVPVYLKDKIEKDPMELEKYCVENLGLNNYSIRIPKIKIQSLIKYNGYLFYISGKTGDKLAARNAVSLCLKRELTNYIKKLENYQQTSVVDTVISQDMNKKLYNELIEKYSTGIFHKRPNPIGNILVNGKELFEKLTITEQCDLLLKVLQFSLLGSTEVDLRAIGGVLNGGKKFINKKVSEADEFLLIHQSMTGLYEKAVNLLTV